VHGDQQKFNNVRIYLIDLISLRARIPRTTDGFRLLSDFFTEMKAGERDVRFLYRFNVSLQAAITFYYAMEKVEVFCIVILQSILFGCIILNGFNIIAILVFYRIEKR
jgi:hypothetical protein